jgi:hypothetical protein
MFTYLNTKGNTMLSVTRKSSLSGIKRTLRLNITSDQLAAYESGRTLQVQNAFPQLSADEREFIKSGVPAAEWKQLFG